MKTEGIKRVFHAWNLIFQEHVEQLTALDSAGGDGAERKRRTEGC